MFSRQDLRAGDYGQQRNASNTKGPRPRRTPAALRQRPRRVGAATYAIRNTARSRLSLRNALAPTPPRARTPLPCNALRPHYFSRGGGAGGSGTGGYFARSARGEEVASGLFAAAYSSINRSRAS